MRMAIIVLRDKHHRFRDSKFGRMEYPGLFSAFNIPFEDKIYFTHNKESSIHNIVRVSLFQQLLANKKIFQIL